MTNLEDRLNAHIEHLISIKEASQQGNNILRELTKLASEIHATVAELCREDSK